MFNKICIKPVEGRFPTDIGFIAENLLYYEKVIIIASQETIPILINNCEVDILIELLKQGKLEILIKENMLGVMSRKLNDGRELNDVVLFHSPELTVEEVIFRSVYKATSRRGYSKRTATKLLDYINGFKYDESICQLIREDLEDEEFVKKSIVETLKIYNPSINIAHSDFLYKKIKADKGFLFHTNLNYQKLNLKLKNDYDDKLISSRGFIVNIQETRGDMYIASKLGAEIATNPINTELMRLKFRHIYEKSLKDSEQIFQFNDFTLDEGHAIQEVINSGDKEFKDFLNVLEKADRFREWLHGISEDKSIIKEYYQATIKETWVEKLPGKAFKWSFFTGAGAMIDLLGAGGFGTISGIALSAGDEFFLQKIIKGWNPSVFINSDLKGLVGK